jgi:two-component system phosphate regulon sensor histidine kinase PhoR
MTPRRPPKNRLNWLAGITTTALLGILVLQGYWLYNSYLQEQTRFRAEVENALTTMIVRTQFSEVYKVAGTSTFNPELQDAIGGLLLSVVGTTIGNPEPYNTGITNPDGTPQKRFFWTQESIDSMPQPKVDSTSGITFTLGDFPEIELYKMQKVMQTVLQKNGIFAPVELALIDSNDKIAETTCDTAIFQKIPLKTLLDNTISLKDGQRIQAALPKVNGLLLRRMAWMLSLSGVFIILGSGSFIYLLKLFFRHKRESEIRNDFLNNMTHELKTPISSVTVALEMIQDKRYPASEQSKAEYFSIAESELARLTLLVDKVLKMAAFERSEIALSPQTFEASPWLTGILASLKPLFESAHAEVHISVLPAGLQLRGDKIHLSNVVQNLLENALKYNNKTLPKIEIAVAQEGAFFVITVTDNGRGIPAAYLSKVFDKFFRIPTGDRHDIKGYGLGLSYVKAIAELHQGSVTVASIPDRQTQFTIRIPGASTSSSST